MGILGRVFARRRKRVWEEELRLLPRLGLVPPPQAVQWIATAACDLSCPHCYSRAGRRADGELTTEEARTLIIDELVPLDRPGLVIAGGEAPLRRDFAELVSHAASRGIGWSLHTHGGQLARHEEVLRRHPPEMVAVSVDGTREAHDAFRGRAGSFEKAMAAIRLLKDAGCPEVVVGTTIHRQNADLLADMLPDVLASGADSWGFHLVTPEGRAGRHPELLPTRAQLRRAAAFARRLRDLFHVELDNEWGSAGRDDPLYRDDTFLCGAGRISCVVSATGEVMPCTTTDPAESQGNVRDRPLSRIWAEGFAAFRGRDDPLRGDCDDCWLQTRHGRSCRAPAFFETMAEVAR